jgi:hypothetical protein
MAKITEMFKQMLIAQNALNEMAKIAMEEKKNVSKRSNKHYRGKKEEENK